MIWIFSYSIVPNMSNSKKNILVYYHLHSIITKVKTIYYILDYFYNIRENIERNPFFLLDISVGNLFYCIKTYLLP